MKKKKKRGEEGLKSQLSWSSNKSELSPASLAAGGVSSTQRENTGSVHRLSVLHSRVCCEILGEAVKQAATEHSMPA